MPKLGGEFTGIQEQRERERERVRVRESESERERDCRRFSATISKKNYEHIMSKVKLCT
jgi:hypothetical protein